MKEDIQETVLVPEPKIVKQGPTSQHLYDDNEPHCHPPALGDIVAVPFVDKNMVDMDGMDEDDKQDFWLGKCLRVITEDSTVLLGWFQKVPGYENKYRMKIGASWLEVSIILLFI